MIVGKQSAENPDGDFKEVDVLIPGEYELVSHPLLALFIFCKEKLCYSLWIVDCGAMDFPRYSHCYKEQCTFIATVCLSIELQSAWFYFTVQWLWTQWNWVRYKDIVCLCLTRDGSTLCEQNQCVLFKLNQNTTVLYLQDTYDILQKFIYHFLRLIYRRAPLKWTFNMGNSGTMSSILVIKRQCAIKYDWWKLYLPSIP